MIRLSLSEPIVAEPYALSREGGRLILVDEATNTTAAAVMISVGGVEARGFSPWSARARVTRSC